MAKAVILEKVGLMNYRDILPEDVYKPSPEEEDLHGTKVLARQSGEPDKGEIEVEAVCGAICTHEVSLFNGDLTHPKYPMIPGHEAVHRVLRVGDGVTNVREGDFVSCCWYMGQWSQKLIGPADSAFLLPEKLDDPAYWIIEPAASIVNAAAMMTLRPGDKVLLIGTGFMGLLMTQLISRYPLAEFVAVDMKPTSSSLANSAGHMKRLIYHHQMAKLKWKGIPPAILMRLLNAPVRKQVWIPPLNSAAWLETSIYSAGIGIQET